MAGITRPGSTFAIGGVSPVHFISQLTCEPRICSRIPCTLPKLTPLSRVNSSSLTRAAASSTCSFAHSLYSNNVRTISSLLIVCRALYRAHGQPVGHFRPEAADGVLAGHQAHVAALEHDVLLVFCTDDGGKRGGGRIRCDVVMLSHDV